MWCSLLCLRLRTFNLSRRKRARRQERRYCPLRFQRLESRTLLSVNGDFNGDGYDDLAIGAPSETIDGIISAGAVSIVYGGRRGLSAVNNQFWHQNSPGIDGVAATTEFFGSALAVGDFNGDGFSDLAIGVKGDKVGGVLDAGGVNVLYGSASGLRATGDQLWNQNSPGIAGTAGVEDQFGYSLAAGDFNGDGRDDLAIGIPQEDVGVINQAGAVSVLFGSAQGLTNSQDQFFTQNSSGINETAELGDRFGWSLAVGDFNNDGRQDLAIGILQESVGAVGGAGAVSVLYGAAAGLSHTGDQFWSQNSSGIASSAQANELFGHTLATGDFNGDGRDDLAISAVGETVGGFLIAGAVHIIFGTNAGLSSVGDEFWTQDSPNIADAAEAFDQFGFALACGDFDGDGRDDLAIGVPFEDIAFSDNGVVHVLFGSSVGLTSIGNLLWTQGSVYAPDVAQASNLFGYALATGDYDGDGRADLAIGVPGEDTSSGIVHVLHQGLYLNLLTPLWSQALLSSSDGSELNDFFGGSLG